MSAQNVKSKIQPKIDWVDNIDNPDNSEYLFEVKFNHKMANPSHETLQMLFMERYYETLQPCSKEYFDNMQIEYTVYCLDAKAQETTFIGWFGTMAEIQAKYPKTLINEPNKCGYFAVVGFRDKDE